MPKPNVIALPHIQNNNPSSQVYTDQRLSIVSIVCRICYDNEKDEPLITPCRCKGTVAFVHRSCLETWLAESNTSTCELCHQIFRTERTPKYSSLRSIWKWIRISPGNNRGARGVKSDLLACGLLTPVAILITYVCLFSSDYYNQKKFATVPAARWTSLSLLFMIGIMLIGYYLWVYSVIRLHARMWYNWWQRECIVKYVPPSTINICPDCPSSSSTPNNTPLAHTGSLENAAQRSENRGEARTASVFQVESNEREIYHEALDKLTDSKHRQGCSTQDSEYSVVDIDEKSEEMKQKQSNCPLSLIQNKGVVYIINISQPDIEQKSEPNFEIHRPLDPAPRYSRSHGELHPWKEVLNTSLKNKSSIKNISLVETPEERPDFAANNEVVAIHSNKMKSKTSLKAHDETGSHQSALSNRRFECLRSDHQSDVSSFIHSNKMKSKTSLKAQDEAGCHQSTLGNRRFECLRSDHETDVSSDESEDTLI